MIYPGEAKNIDKVHCSEAEEEAAEKSDHASSSLLEHYNQTKKILLKFLEIPNFNTTP